MASFQAKISWERLRKREKKNHFNDFLPDPQQKIKKKIAKKLKKIKKQYCGFFPSQNKLGKAEKERK